MVKARRDAGRSAGPWKHTEPTPSAKESGRTGGVSAPPRAERSLYPACVPTARVNGLDVYFERRGRGPRLLFLNGSGTTLARTRPMLDPFAERFDTVAHDQRGLGQTEIPP